MQYFVDFVDMIHFDLQRKVLAFIDVVTFLFLESDASYVPGVFELSNFLYLKMVMNVKIQSKRLFSFMFWYISACNCGNT